MKRLYYQKKCETPLTLNQFHFLQAFILFLQNSSTQDKDAFGQLTRAVDKTKEAPKKPHPASAFASPLINHMHFLDDITFVSERYIFAILKKHYFSLCNTFFTKMLLIKPTEDIQGQVKMLS